MSSNHHQPYPSHHPEGGSVVAVNIDGRMYINPANKAYMEQVKTPVGTPTSLNKIKSDSVNHAGFSKSKKIDESKSTREETLERLVLNQAHEARLLSQLEKVRSVISSLKKDLENN